MPADQRLNLALTVMDRATGPITRVQQAVDKLANRTRRASASIAAGAATMAASIYTMAQALGMAQDHVRALAALNTLGLGEDNLQNLNRVAKATAAEFGMDATQIVRSAYDIQSAIAGLTGNELAAFTKASAVLAKGTLADPAVITDYMGTLYGIFGPQANAMGRDVWVEVTAGMTAQAVQMYKTTGGKMAQAFTSLGSMAASMGVSQAEQFAVLGNLGASMGGGESGTKFRAFLRGVGRAAQTMGLDFTDATGNMLPVWQILERINEATAGMGAVARSDYLTKAFGSDEAVGFLANMLEKVGALRTQSEMLGRTSGMQAAVEMANRATTAYDKMTSSLSVMRTSFGEAFNQAMAPAMLKVADWANNIANLADRFPHLTAMVALFTVGILALTAAVGALAIISAVLQVIWSPVTGIILLVAAAIGVIIYALYRAFEEFVGWWDDMVEKYNWLKDKVGWTLDAIGQGWEDFTDNSNPHLDSLQDSFVIETAPTAASGNTTNVNIMAPRADAGMFERAQQVSLRN